MDTNIKNMKLVSVIIPCFNHGKYIDEAVESILNQTYQFFEIIIVDDGSTDPATVKKLKYYKAPKTRVIRTKNRGLPAARNRGIKEAKGEYILTLDADDMFEPTFLQEAVKVLASNPSTGVVTCYFEIFGKSQSIAYPKGGTVKNFLINSNCCSSALFRKTCWKQVKGYDESMTEGCEDWNFWLQVTSKGWSVHVIKEILFRYRTTDGAMHFKSDLKRPELFKKIVQKNKNIYNQYIDQVVFEEELIIQKLINSKAARIANYTKRPLRHIRTIMTLILYQLRS